MGLVNTIYTPEHQMLDTLLKAMYKQMEADLNEDSTSDFLIIINNTVVHFTLGGPQFEGLLAFINHIAAENWHEVDLDNRTVTGLL